MTSPVFIFDFDSTLVRIETLEALAEIALSDAPDAAAKKAEIAALTDQAMTGQVDFGTALRRRLDLLALRHGHVETLTDRILDEASASVRRNVDFFERHAEAAYASIGKFCSIASNTRVNALEHFLIPGYEETIRYITMKLSENERGAVTRLMKVKDMIVAKAIEERRSADN